MSKDIVKIIVKHPYTVEGIHDEIPYLLPFGDLVAIDSDGNEIESSDGIIWTKCAKHE